MLDLVNQPATGVDQLPQLQRHLTAELQAIEQKVNSGIASVSSGEWQSLKRVLIYWADEILTTHVTDWQNYVLEQEYFGEKNRAWKFYVEGEQCIPTGSSEAAELFYLAVVLGFKGDIEGAFKHELNRELPGKKPILTKLDVFGPRKFNDELFTGLPGICRGNRSRETLHPSPEATF